MENEHVRIEPDGTYVCRHCHDFYKPNLPCPITMAEVMMAEWMRLHKDCEAWKIKHPPIQPEHLHDK